MVKKGPSRGVLRDPEWDNVVGKSQNETGEARSDRAGRGRAGQGVETPKLGVDGEVGAVHLHAAPDTHSEKLRSPQLRNGGSREAQPPRQHRNCVSQPTVSPYHS